MKQNFLTVLLSLLLIPIWGLGLLAINTSNAITVFIVIFGSSGSLYYFLKNYPIRRHYLVLIGPLVYLVFVLFAHLFLQKQEEFYFHPVVWAALIYFMAYFLSKFSMRRVYLRLLVATALYSFVLYPNSTYYHPLSNEIETVDSQLNKRFTLQDFKFIDQNGKRKIIPRKYVLIETWNESCIPCLKSIKNLQDSLSAFSTCDNFYLYQERGKEKLSKDSILNFTSIKEKSKILIDPNNQLFDSLDLDAYPYFLLFDKRGKLIAHRKGYAKEIEADILQWLRVNIKEE
ncbi:MAG: hypothetical protein RIC95_06150 [Vicingaceae bacterium]